MKTNTIIKYKFLVDHYIPVVDGETTSYQLNATLNAFVMAGGNSGIWVVTNDALGVGDQLRNVRDAGGTVVFQNAGTEYPMYVVDATPQFDIWSHIIGWKSTLRRQMPTNIRDVIGTLDVS